MELSTCENCGKVMDNPSDFGGRITSNTLCNDCSDLLGNKRKYNDVLSESAHKVAKHRGFMMWIKNKFERKKPKKKSKAKKNSAEVV